MADLKRAIKDGSVDWADCLRGAPPEEHALGTDHIRIEAFLKAVRGLGETTAEQIVAAAGVKPRDRVGEMGHATRQHLTRLAVMALDPFDPRLGKIDAEALEEVETASTIDEPAIVTEVPPANRTRWTGPAPVPPEPDYPPELDTEGREP